MQPPTVLAMGLAHPEGPSVLPDGRIVFVETFRGQISAWDPTTGVTLFVTVDGAPCACILGTDGLYVTQAGGRIADWRSSKPMLPSIQRVDWNGQVKTIADTADGEALLAPNDLAFGADGCLYFTDPGQFNPDQPDHGRICVVRTDATVEVVKEVGPTYPNGITVEANGDVIWVESYTRRVRRLRADGAVELVATLEEHHIPDGLKISADGCLYITTVTSHGIDVITPDGRSVAFIETGGEPQNCVFDGTDLVVTDFGEHPNPDAGLATGPACGRLLRVPVGVEGQPLPRGSIDARG